ncbi:hypothetical protein P7K49_016776 [Saguinus oedipus]|uniref:Uncharacterized protein n=1 Tax=Saguinus oedipus TaxID=9490 RepID=A0ABQ9VDE8_SAGOE|nr:hypothetical protein P7K49_016776 [Saguinus oedipus]
MSQVLGQGMVADQQKALEYPPDNVYNLYFRFYSPGVLCIPKEKEVIAMRSDPLLLDGRLWSVIQPEINPQLYLNSVQVVCRYPVFTCVPQTPKQVFKRASRVGMAIQNAVSQMKQQKYPTKVSFSSQEIPLAPTSSYHSTDADFTGYGTQLCFCATPKPAPFHSKDCDYH